MTTKAKWTILTYIAAHNNIQYFGKRSYDQIISVGSTPEVVQGMLFDWPDGAARYIAGSPGEVLKQEQLGNYDSGDPDNLIRTAQWVFGQYPAEHYGLILWSHGSGWQPNEIEQIAKQVRGDNQVDKKEANVRASTSGSMAFFRSTLQTILKKEKANERAICFDDGTGHSLDTLELDRVTKEIADSIGQKLDLIGMDACLMANLEVAYQLRKNIGYMVASEELVPGNSWPYDIIFSILQKTPDFQPRDLSELVVNEYLSYYRKHPLSFGNGDITKIALDLSKTDVFITSMKGLAEALIANVKEAIHYLEKAQTDTYMVETCEESRVANKFNFHLWDIMSVARHLAKNIHHEKIVAAANNVIDTFNKCGLVVCSDHLGEWFDNTGGLSVYLIAPKRNKPRHISDYYTELAFSKDAKWNDLLLAYDYNQLL
jgi:hypothetical protein